MPEQINEQLPQSKPTNSYLKIASIIFGIIILIIIILVVLFFSSLSGCSKVDGLSCPVGFDAQYSPCTYSRSSISVSEAKNVIKLSENRFLEMDITSLSPEVAKALSAYGGEQLKMDKLTDISDEVAEILGDNFTGKIISLNGLKSISDKSTVSLSKIRSLYINGLDEISDSQVEIFTIAAKNAQGKNEVYISPVKLYGKLAELCNNYLEFSNSCKIGRVNEIDKIAALNLIAAGAYGGNLDTLINDKVYSGGLSVDEVNTIVTIYNKIVGINIEKKRTLIPLELIINGNINSDIVNELSNVKYGLKLNGSVSMFDSDMEKLFSKIPEKIEIEQIEKLTDKAALILVDKLKNNPDNINIKYYPRAISTYIAEFCYYSDDCFFDNAESITRDGALMLIDRAGFNVTLSSEGEYQKIFDLAKQQVFNDGLSVEEAKKIVEWHNIQQDYYKKSDSDHEPMALTLKDAGNISVNVAQELKNTNGGISFYGSYNVPPESKEILKNLSTIEYR